MNKQDNSIIWTGNFFDYGGYSYMNRKYVRGLAERDWKVNIESIRSPIEVDEDERKYFADLGRHENASYFILDEKIEKSVEKEIENSVRTQLYSQAEQEIIQRISAVGNTISPEKIEQIRTSVYADKNAWFDENINEIKYKRVPRMTPPPSKALKVVCWLPLTNTPRPPGGKRVIYTMMETQKVNATFINRCNSFYEECWTPTKYNAEGFKEMGMTIPIKQLPVGIDPIFNKINAIDNLHLNYDVFGAPDAPEMPEGFKFLSVFRWSFGKGFDALIKSYLKEFKKSDNTSLIIVSRHAAMNHDPAFKEAIKNDIRELVDKYGDGQSPPIYLCGDIIPMDLMPSMYNIGDAFITCSRGEGFCTFPDAKIKTPNGVREIKDIKVGDYVFSHKGNPEKVLNTFEREYDGEMVEIQSYGRSNQKLTLTPNHRVFALKCSNLYREGVSKIINKSKFDFNENKLKYSETHHNIKYTDYNFEWIDAGNIEEGDLLFYPKLNYGENVDFIELESIEEIKEKFNIRDNTITSKIKNQTGECIGDGKTSIDFKRIKINHDLMQLIGYYVSEGNSSSSNLNFTFNKNEIEYQDHVKDLMNKVMKIECGKDQVYENKEATNIVYHNSIIKTIFGSLFGSKAKEKHLPNWVMSLDKELLFSLVKTLFRGDGHIINESTLEKSSYSTSSEELANNIFDILQKIGISSSIKKRKHNNEKYHGFGNYSFSVNITNIDDAIFLLNNTEDAAICVKKRKSHKVFLTKEDYQILKVKKIKKINYSGVVCNLHVDNDNTYVCENIAVHNCIPAIEASAMGLPIIIPNHTGFTEYNEPDKCFTFDVDDWVVCNSVPEWNRGWITRDFAGQLFPKFGDEACEQIGSIMRDVMENYDDALKVNEKMQNLIKERFSWENCIDKLESHISEL